MKNIAYFDNAATTYKKPKEVHDFMYNYYSNNSYNVGRSNNTLNSSNIISETRELLLKLFNANSNYEAIITPSATEAINIILQGQNWDKNDYVYISPFEHNAVYRTVKYLEKNYLLKIKELSVDKKTLEFNFEKIKYQFNNYPPKFIICSHVSNVCGKIQSIYELGKLVKKYNALYLVDCAQSAGILETNIIKCKADYMIFAGHKTLYGPFGASGFICNKNVAPSPMIYGGTGIDSANYNMPSDLPTKYEAGSKNILSISGLNAALKWINMQSIKKICFKEKENYDKLYNILSSYDNISIIGRADLSSSIISCQFEDYTPIEIGNFFEQNNLIVRTGLHCSPLAHKFLNTFPEGTVRFSVSYFTNDNDFNKLEEILGEI